MGQMISRMEERRIFTVAPTTPGSSRFLIEELCDYYYSDELSADELRLLGEELIAMASSVLNSD